MSAPSVATNERICTPSMYSVTVTVLLLASVTWYVPENPSLFTPRLLSDPDITGAYTWWSYRFNARANNAGWRIDYFLVSDRIKENIQDVIIHNQVFGSDHCPVTILLEGLK